MISIHPMYSAGQVALATFLGGPLGGGWLMALNYKRLGEPAKARMAIVLSVLAMAALIAIGFALPKGSALFLAVFPFIVMSGLASGLQGVAYARHVTVGGSRGSSWRAAGLGVASLAIYFGAICGAFAIRFTAILPDKVMVGGSSVFYTDGVPRAEAEAVGEELIALQHRSRDAEVSIEVTRDGDRHVVAFVMKDIAFSNDQIQLVYHQLAEPLSRKVYGGAPVDVWFLDAALRPHTKLSWETRSHSLDLGDDHTVLYREGIQETEARGVAKVLQDHGVFQPGRKASVTVKTVSSRYVVAFELNSNAIADTELQTAFHRLAKPCSDQAFGGQPVDVWLEDEDGITHAKLSWESVPVSSIELETVELPGLTIKLPAVDKPAADDPWAARPESSYVSGKVERERKSTFVVDVTWKFGKLADDSTLSEIRRVTAADLDHPLALPASGLPTRSFRAKLKGRSFLITEIACGARRFEIWTGSDIVDIEALQRSMLATVRCHPDPEQESQFADADLDRAIGWNRREARIDLASRAGWKQLESPKGVLVLVRDDGTTLVVMALENEPSSADLKLLFRNDPLEIGTGDPRPLHGMMRGNPTRGWMHPLNCSTDGWMLMAYLEADNEHPPGGKDVVTGARCLDKGASAVSWPKL